MGGECREQVEADLVRSSSDYRHVVDHRQESTTAVCLLASAGPSADCSGLRGPCVCIQDWRACLQLHGCKPEFALVDPKRLSTEQSIVCLLPG